MTVVFARDPAAPNKLAGDILSLIAAHIYRRTGRVVEPEPEDHLFDDLGCDDLDRVEICIAIEEAFGTPQIAEGRVFFVRDLLGAAPHPTEQGV